METGDVPMTRSQTNERIHALDAVRAFAMLLGVVHHSTLPYIKDVRGWAIIEKPNDTAAAIFYLIHWLRLPVFFLIAGFFGRMVLERKGLMPFVKDRAKRILVPLLLGFPAVFITVVIAFVLGALASGMTLQQLQNGMQQGIQGRPQQASTGGGGIQLAHLWFLYYLLMFYAAALVVRPLLGRFAPAADAAVRFIMRGFWAPLLLAAPLVAYFYQNEAWLSWYGVPSPGYSLVPQVDALVGYGMVFGFGWLLHRQADLLFALVKRWPVYLGAAVVLSVVCLSIAGLTPRWKPYLHGRDLLIYTVAYMTGLWCWALGLVGVGLRFLSDASPRRRYIADSSYWLYLMHMSVIVFFTTLFIPLHWHWSVKYLLTIAGSTLLLLLSYHYLVRSTWIGAILNGRRHPRVRANAAQPAAATS
jgi:glucan biosynthesis protein C